VGLTGLLPFPGKDTFKDKSLNKVDAATRDQLTSAQQALDAEAVHRNRTAA